MKCFLATPTGNMRVWLRRYSISDTNRCSSKYAYHNGMTFVQDVLVEKSEDGCIKEPKLDITKDDARWPVKCDYCDYLFVDTDRRQEFTDQLYSNGTDIWPLRDLPPGAMYLADWWSQDHFWDNGEGKPSLIVKLPNGHEWNVDSRCNNCTLPDDRTHRCWIRTGEPPNVTVGKGPGATCSAGAGSVQVPEWHGFLRNGELVSA